MKRSYMVTGYQINPGSDPERIAWYAPTLSMARELVNRPGHVLTRCDIWQLVETLAQEKAVEK